MNAFLRLLLLLCAVASIESRISQKEVDALTDRFIEQIRHYSDEIREWAYGIAVDRELSRADYLTCDVCHPALLIARPILEGGGDEGEDILTDAITRVCKLLNLAPSDKICEPTIRGYVTPIAYMLLNKPSMSNNDFCGMINEDCGAVNASFYDWETEVAPGKPPAVVRPLLPNDVPRTKILQFTDIHLDLDYTVGALAECDLPICCRADTGEPGAGDPIAGKYGHGRCGLSYAGMEEMFMHASANHADAKYILLTGDYIHSGVWLYNETENERHISNVTQTLAKFFPTTPVIVVTGNHETPTVNMYPPPIVEEPEFSLRWMYEAMSSPFEDYMESPTQIDSFKQRGYYTVYHPEERLRFIVLNTNICYIQNFWLPYDTIDPFRQLQWLSETLYRAEEANENVLIVAHIPPGSGACWTHWSNQYHRIIDRYAHIIRFQVFGHTHNEFFIVTLDRDVSEGDKPISVGFAGPCAVAEGAGVAYKVYYADGGRGTDSTWELIDHETWMLNNTLSHQNNRPEWYIEFSASEAFGLKTQRPEEYYDLSLRMINDKDLFEQFRRYYRKDNHEDAGPCEDTDCVNEIMCHTVDYNAADRTTCNKFKKMVDKAYNGVESIGLPSAITLLITFMLRSAAQ